MLFRSNLSQVNIALVTGGSRGIGAASAVRLAKDGWTVAVNFRANAIAADVVVAQCRDQGADALAIAADVAVEEQVQSMFRVIDHELGPLSALVNNAGVVVAPPSRVADLSFERLQRIFSINVIGSFLCAREAVNRMSFRNGGSGGSVVNVSSIASRFGGPHEYVDYAATKGAIDTMTLGLSKEVAEEGIRVNAVRPGLIHTDFHASGGDPDRADRMGTTVVPMKRAGEPLEVANTIAWLCSPEASYVTGALIDVSGGR